MWCWIILVARLVILLTLPNELSSQPKNYWLPDCGHYDCGYNAACIYDSDRTPRTCNCTNLPRSPRNRTVVCLKLCGGVTCGANKTCAISGNNQQTPQCLCAPGYLPHGERCVAGCEKNPCAHPMEVCRLRPMGVPLCYCKDGYFWENGTCWKTCKGPSDCSDNSTCLGIREHVHVCVCKPGYSRTLTGQCAAGCEINPCAYPNQVCRVRPRGVPLCLCKDGYFWENGTCWKACKSHRDCPENSKCRDIREHAFICVCKPGYLRMQTGQCLVETSPWMNVSMAVAARALLQETLTSTPGVATTAHRTMQGTKTTEISTDVGTTVLVKEPMTIDARALLQETSTSTPGVASTAHSTMQETKTTEISTDASSQTTITFDVASLKGISDTQTTELSAKAAATSQTTLTSNVASLKGISETQTTEMSTEALLQETSTSTPGVASTAHSTMQETKTTEISTDASSQTTITFDVASLKGISDTQTTELSAKGTISTSGGFAGVQFEGVTHIGIIVAAAIAGVVFFSVVCVIIYAFIRYRLGRKPLRDSSDVATPRNSSADGARPGRGLNPVSNVGYREGTFTGQPLRPPSVTHPKPQEYTSEDDLDTLYSNSKIPERKRLALEKKLREEKNSEFDDYLAPHYHTQPNYDHIRFHALL